MGTALCVVAALGCDMLKKGGDEETEAATATAEPEPEPEPETSTAEAAEDDTEVKKYDDMVRDGGTYRLLKQFVVYTEADAASTELKRLAHGTIVNFRYRRGEWRMVEWPSGVGELSPGWIQLRRVDLSQTKKIEHRTSCKSAADCGGKACCYIGMKDQPTACGSDSTCGGYSMPVICSSTANCPAHPALNVKLECRAGGAGGYKTCQQVEAKKEDPKKEDPKTDPTTKPTTDPTTKPTASGKRGGKLIKRPF